MATARTTTGSRSMSSWRTSTLAAPVTITRQTRAVTRLVPGVEAVVTLGWEGAVGMHVVAGEAIKALAHQVRRDGSMRGGTMTPMPLALHRKESLTIRLNRHVRGVDHDGD